MKILAIWAALAALSAPASSPAAAAEPDPASVQVMVVGTWHFAGSDSDLVSFDSADMRAPERQAELEAIAAALAEFRPNVVAVERVAPAPDLIDPGYARFTPAMLTEQRDERVQLAYRLAHRLGIERVYAIDEQPGEGEPDYFPFGRLIAYDRDHGPGDLPQRVQRRAAEMMAEFADKQARLSLAQMLIEASDPDRYGGISSYYELLAIGDTEDQPGAELNALYYMRNAKIFAKLMRVVGPGDRVLVVYGSGHNYWLRHFADETPGFENVDPRPYLERAVPR